MSDPEKSRTILKTAYEELYSGIVEGQFPEWYVQGLPSHAKALFDNGDPRDVVPRFLEILGLKAAQEILENGGNALSAIEASTSVNEYGRLLFSMRWARPRIFKGEPRYPIDPGTCRNLALRAAEVTYEELEPLFQKVLGKKDGTEHFTKSEEQRRIEEVMFILHCAVSRAMAVAEGRIGLENGKIVATSRRPASIEQQHKPSGSNLG